MASGGGTSATKFAERRPSRARRSPPRSPRRRRPTWTRAGLGGVESGHGVEPVGRPRCGTRARSRAPREVSCQCSGMPARCAPTTASLIDRGGAARSSGGGAVGARRRQTGRASVEQPRLAPRRSDEADAKAGAVVAEAGRDGDGGHVQQVHEIGVESEVGVEGERLGQHFGDAVDGRARWAAAGRRRRAHSAAAARSIGLQGVEALEGVDGRDTGRRPGGSSAPPDGWRWARSAGSRPRAAARSATHGPW